MKLTKINNRVNFLYEKSEKFKTFTISFYFHNKLSLETASLNALLPYVLKRGSENYKDMAEISNALEELYGGAFDVSVIKKGEDQIVGFTFEFISPKYVKDDDCYIKNVYKFIFDIIFSPLVSDNAFLPQYVSSEKENMIDYIKGIINDKKEYAQLRCIEEMFEGDNYSVFKYGSVDKINEINEKNLYDHYLSFINDSRIDVFLTGNLDSKELEEKLYLLNLTDANIKYPKTSKKEPTEKIKEVTDSFDVAQGKLSMGFTTSVTSEDEERYALSVFNSIYGSGAHSKLFNNVREKLSLCYYAYSRLDAKKGVMYVNSGVEFKNFETAYNEILAQLDDIAKGKIEDSEINAAKKAIINVLRGIEDSCASTEDYMLNCLINEKTVEIDEYIAKIEKVTKEEIIEVANKIKLDTVYYLTGGKK